jgi:NAD(P)-dependent dehydrogenase (short-subunit alcohol dehydrogenase family)
VCEDPLTRLSPQSEAGSGAGREEALSEHGVSTETTTRRGHSDGRRTPGPAVAMKRDDYRRVAAMLAQRFGRLAILVKNAGLKREGADGGAPGGCNDTSTVSEAALRATFETHCFAVLAWTQTLLPLMRRAPAGGVVNLASILGSLTLHADPTSPIDKTKACAHDASTTALDAFTVHLAAELQETPIKVSAAHPGWVKTARGGRSPCTKGGGHNERPPGHAAGRWADWRLLPCGRAVAMGVHALISHFAKQISHWQVCGGRWPVLSSTRKFHNGIRITSMNPSVRLMVCSLSLYVAAMVMFWYGIARHKLAARVETAGHPALKAGQTIVGVVETAQGMVFALGDDVWDEKFYDI